MYKRHLLDTTPGHAQRLEIPHPILSDEELASLKQMDKRGWRTRTIDITFDKSEGRAGMTQALDLICNEASQAIEDGYSLIILSDRDISETRVPLSSLVACGAVHHQLVKTFSRTRIGLVLETGEAREVHHHCLLTGYGADAINPYLAFEAIWEAREKGQLPQDQYSNYDSIVTAYRKAVAKGMLKVMAKMGISTLQSYKSCLLYTSPSPRD